MSNFICLAVNISLLVIHRLSKNIPIHLLDEEFQEYPGQFFSVVVALQIIRMIA